MSEMTHEMRGFWKRLEIALGFISLALWVSWYGLWIHYVRTRSPFPDPITGRTYLLDTHGYVVYLTSTENFRLWALACSAAALFIIAVFIDVAKRVSAKYENH
jgi:hypothetical protein